MTRINRAYDHISDGRLVLVPAEGHNYHIYDDCYGIKLGRTYHVEAGHELRNEHWMQVREAVEGMGKYACRVCYKRAELPIPAQADRVALRAKARADRMAAKAAKAEAATVKVAADDKVAEINAQVAAAIATLKALIAMRNKAMRVATAA